LNEKLLVLIGCELWSKMII